MTNKPFKINNEWFDIDIENVVGIDNEEIDRSVNYYQPFCIILKDNKNKNVQLYLNHETLIDLARLLKPYLDNEEAEIKADAEMYQEWLKEQEENGK
jgi:hypothetical protein